MRTFTSRLNVQEPRRLVFAWLKNMFRALMPACCNICKNQFPLSEGGPLMKTTPNISKSACTAWLQSSRARA